MQATVLIEFCYDTQMRRLSLLNAKDRSYAFDASPISCSVNKSMLKQASVKLTIEP